MKRCLCAMLCTLLFLTGCYPKGSVADTDHYTPYYIADANVVWADNLNAAQFDRVSLVEQDIYGRQYFCYATYSVFLQCNIEIHLISQQAKAELAYYYPEDCYRIRTATDEPFTDEQTMQFKSRNDWNRPLSLEKCYIAEDTQETLVYGDTFQETLRRHLKLNDSYSVLFNDLEMLAENQQIYGAYVFTEQGEESYYILVYENSPSDRILACEEIDYASQYHDAIQEFRRKLE